MWGPCPGLGGSVWISTSHTVTAVPPSFLLSEQILALAPLLLCLAVSWAQALVVSVAVAPWAQLVSLPCLLLPVLQQQRCVLSQGSDLQIVFTVLFS